MCGFGISTIFEVAIVIIVVLAVLAMLRAVFPGALAVFGGGGQYGNIISIVVGAVVAIVILLILWRIAECAGLVGGRLGELALPFYG